jgi:hypothetical protein
LSGKRHTLEEEDNMRRFRRHRTAPVLVVACIGLTIAIGGTSYAAVSLPRNGGGTDQLRNDAVTSIRADNVAPAVNAAKPATATTAGSTHGVNAATAR